MIESNCLTKNYGKLTAINNLSLQIEENKITGLIGRNGAGKTTLLKLIAGFLAPTAGEITVWGANPFNSIKVSANMIFIDDNLPLPPDFSLAEILDFAGRFYQNWDMVLAKRLLEYFELSPKQRQRSLSKGMNSTFNSILGVAARCALTIFDEPTTGMDSAVRKDFYKALLKDYLDYPRNIILSSHLVGEIEDLLEDIILLRDGELCMYRPVNELKEFAVGLSGREAAVNELARARERFHQESFGKDTLYTVVKDDFSAAQRQNAKLAGVEISPVAIDDLCVYLTAKAKGGIDDVFKRS